MKRIKRTFALFAALAVLLASLAVPAAASHTTADFRTVALECDDLFLVPSHTDSTSDVLTVNGEVPDEYSFFRVRLSAFSNAYDCGVYFGCVSSPDQLGFDSFDAFREAFLAKYPDALGSNAVCVLYDQSSGASQVHVGSTVAKNCDTTPVTEALLDPEAKDNYWHMVHVLDALQDAVARPGAYLLYCPEEHYAGVRKNLGDLRKKFPGMVFVYYVGTGETLDNVMDTFAAIYEVYRLDDFYSDSIGIFYYCNTGETDIWLGSDLDMRVDDMDAVRAAFAPTEIFRNYDGFASGVEALASHLDSGRSLPSYVAPMLLGIAVAILALAMVIEVIAGKRGKPLNLESAGK